VGGEGVWLREFGSSKSYEVNPQMTVSSFKNAIARMEGVGVESISFVCVGAIMIDNRPLSFYSSKSCTIYRVLVQRGC